MRTRNPGFTLAALFALAVVVAGAPAAPGGQPAPAPEAVAPAAAATDTASCEPALADLFAPAAAASIPEAPAGAVGGPSPLPRALAPHCCSQGEVDACRTGCKAQGPGCKGQIGCRAGECVCTCVCP